LTKKKLEGNDLITPAKPLDKSTSLQPPVCCKVPHIVRATKLFSVFKNVVINYFILIYRIEGMDALG